MILAAKTYYPFLNTAFLFSLFLTLALMQLARMYGKRRPAGKRFTWGEAMLGSLYVYFVCFLAYGVVPHHWLNHATGEVGWRKDKFLWGPGGILKPRSAGGWNPITLQYAAVSDIVATLIYIVFLGLQIFVWIEWQNRGKAKKSAGELMTSTFGRPLVKKS
jgi:Na+-driven multidrug efflux pump